MSHWYLPDGSPYYTVVGKNGKERGVTLRDARPVKAVPSVTTVMAVQDKPNLLIWKQNQLKEAVANNGSHPQDRDGFEAWWRSCIADSNEVAKQAAENGTLIHDNIETHIKTGLSDLQAISEPVVEFLTTNFEGFEWVAEDSFAHPLGFGGKIDLYGIKNKGVENEERMVLDFKTKLKSKEEMEKIKAYDDHHLQTAAYVKGLEDTKNFGSKLDYSGWKRYNLFIGYELVDNSFTFTGLKLTESKDFEREWGMFEKLLEFWKLKNSYLLGD